MFNNHCRELYGIGTQGIIDGILQKFWGHCRFTCPARQGDIEIGFGKKLYMDNGKEGSTPALNLSAQVVKKFAEPLKGSNHKMLHVIDSLQMCLYLKSFIKITTRKRLLLALLPKQASAEKLIRACLHLKIV